MKLILPEPPSANRWWRKFRGRIVKSPEARRYQVLAHAQAIVQCGAPLPRYAIGRPVRVTIRWFRGARRGDLDKRLGVALDALQGVVYVNDAQIVELRAIRQDDARRPRIEIDVEAA